MSRAGSLSVHLCYWPVHANHWAFLCIKNFHLAILSGAVFCWALRVFGSSLWIEFAAKNIIAGIKLTFPSDELQDVHHTNKREN